MVSILIVCLLIFLILILSEFLRRTKKLKPELTRKLVHISSGVLVAFLPYFVDYQQIQILSLAFLFVIGLSIKFNIFRSIHSVKRVTKGEIFFAVSIGVCALLQPADWIFTVAILHLALADALAAIVGTKWGRRTHYTILSHGKSLLGSLAFFYASMVIFLGLIALSSTQLPSVYLLVLVIPTILTLLENISWYGADNLTVPLMTIFLLSSIS